MTAGFQNRRLLTAALLPFLGTVGCASSSRGTAATVAQSGLSATSQFSTDVRELGIRLVRGDAQNAFSRTWEFCQIRPTDCRVQIPSETLRAARQDLAKAIASRAQAIEALAAAYGAMKTEADYDARADLSGAVDEALKSAVAYASLAGAPPLVSRAASNGASFGLGLLADQQQSKRLRAANLALAGVVEQLHAGLAKETAVFDSLAGDIVNQEAQAQQALLQAGLISGGDTLRPLTDSVGATPIKDIDAVLAKSPAAKVAVEAVVQVAALEKVAAIRARYAASLAALDELKRLHLSAAEDKPLNTASLNRLLSEIDVLITRLESK